MTAVCDAHVVLRFRQRVPLEELPAGGYRLAQERAAAGLLGLFVFCFGRVFQPVSAAFAKIFEDLEPISFWCSILANQTAWDMCPAWATPEPIVGTSVGGWRDLMLSRRSRPMQSYLGASSAAGSGMAVPEKSEDIIQSPQALRSSLQIC